MAKKKKKETEFKFNQFAKNPRITDNDKLEKLDENLKYFGDLSGIVHNIKTDELICGNQRGKTLEIDQSKITIVEKFDEPDEQGTVSLGYVEHNGHKYNFRQVDWTQEKADKAAVIANVHAGQWNFHKLGSDWNSDFIKNAGFTDFELESIFGKEKKDTSIKEEKSIDIDSENSELIVEIDDVDKIKELFEELTERGFSCRILTL